MEQRRVRAALSVCGVYWPDLQNAGQSGDVAMETAAAEDGQQAKQEPMTQRLVG